MRNLKILAIVVAAWSITADSVAQTITAKAGLNLANFYVATPEGWANFSYKLKPGLQVGGIANLPLSEFLSLETGMVFATKGTKSDLDQTVQGESFRFRDRVNVLYMEIPLNAKGSFEIGKARVYGNFGPYFGLALAGWLKSVSDFSGETTTDFRRIPLGKDATIGRFDFGLVGASGVEINRIQIGISYGFSLVNISTMGDWDYKLYNRVLGMSAGYIFGKK